MKPLWVVNSKEEEACCRKCGEYTFRIMKITNALKSDEEPQYKIMCNECGAAHIIEDE